LLAVEGDKTHIEGRVAIVTGAGSGIGAACAIRLASAGARVVLAGLVPDELETVRAEIGSDASTVTLPVDLTKPNAKQQMLSVTEESFGPPDVLINAAGLAWMVPAEELEMSDWHRVFDINIHALFAVTQAVGRRMIAQRGGVIVNVASMAGLHGMPNHAAYVASKHAVVGLTKALAIEWARYGIRVNCLCPGVTETEMVRNAMVQAPEVWKGRVGRTLWGRLATPDEQAAMVEFMVSSDASYVSGLIANVDGGNHGLYSGYPVPQHLS
jgi:NAD(P)-dependent dehydrogenase (short-subunit alcohol dehydrogenase family)